MNIADKFNEKKRNEQEQNEIKRQEKVKNLANKVITTLSDDELVESVENYLLKYGSVTITDFGCLCQGGACSWQKGLDELLQPLKDTWEEKGVKIWASIDFQFYVNSPSIGSFERKYTIEQLKEWNKNNK